MKPNKRKHKSPLNTSTKAIARKNNSKGYPKQNQNQSQKKRTQNLLHLKTTFHPIKKHQRRKYRKKYLI